MGALVPELAQQLEEAHREGPDLCGMAVVSPAATSGNPSTALLRLGFLGHVSVQQFADPVALPGSGELQHQATEPAYDIFPHSAAAVGGGAAQQTKQGGRPRVWQGQRLRPVRQRESEQFCSMRGHHTIAQGALQACRTDVDSDAEVLPQAREALSSLLQDTEVIPSFSFVSPFTPSFVTTYARLMHQIRAAQGSRNSR